MNIPFTLVSTVFNEKRRLEQTINDLKQQTLQPNEIIITDAGSTDGTYEALNEWSRQSNIPIKILQQKGCNVAEGRNMAIRVARHELIVSTDFGCRFDKNWLQSLVAPFDDPAVNVVGGAYSVIEADLNNLPEKAAYVLSNGYKVDVNTDYFIPSSRSIAYKKHVFDTVGGYCEWLTLAADDLIFGMLIQKHGFKIVTVDKPYVFWGRHTKATGYAKESFRYGLGDGESKIKAKQVLKYAVFFSARWLFLLLALVLVLNLAFNFFNAPLVLWVFAAFLLVGFRPYYSYLKSWLKLRSEKYNFSVFCYGCYLLEITHLGYLKGYYKGFLFSSENKKEGARLLKQQLQQNENRSIQHQ